MSMTTIALKGSWESQIPYFSRCLQKGHFVDVHLICSDGVVLYGNSALMASASRFLRSLLEFHQREQTTVILLPEFEAVIVKHVLSFMYGGKIKGLRPEHTKKFLQLLKILEIKKYYANDQIETKKPKMKKNIGLEEKKEQTEAHVPKENHGRKDLGNEHNNTSFTSKGSNKIVDIDNTSLELDNTELEVSIDAEKRHQDTFDESSDSMEVEEQDLEESFDHSEEEQSHQESHLNEIVSDHDMPSSDVDHLETKEEQSHQESHLNEIVSDHDMPSSDVDHLETKEEQSHQESHLNEIVSEVDPSENETTPSTMKKDLPLVPQCYKCGTSKKDIQSLLKHLVQLHHLKDFAQEFKMKKGECCGKSFPLILSFALHVGIGHAEIYALLPSHFQKELARALRRKKKRRTSKLDMEEEENNCVMPFHQEEI